MVYTISMKNDKSQYRVPLGDGRVKVTLWKNWLIHKFDNPDLWWMEEEPLLIFPDCMRPIETTGEEDDNRI